MGFSRRKFTILMLSLLCSALVTRVPVLANSQTGSPPLASLTMTPTPSSRPTPSPSPTLPPTHIERFSPVADSTIDTRHPQREYGSSVQLVTDGKPEKAAYLKFDLTHLKDVSISQAALHLFVTNGSVDRQDIFFLTNSSWNEETLTAATRPTDPGRLIASFTQRTRGAWIEEDLTSLIREHMGHEITLQIRSSGEDSFACHSRESKTHAPYLELTF